VKTVATTSQGVPELIERIAQFRAHSAATQAARRRTRSEYRLRELVSQRFMDHLERQVLDAGELTAIVERIAAREIDPYTAANDLLARAGVKAGGNARPMATDGAAGGRPPSGRPAGR
jgi:LAO/AO transport system kinase